MKTKIIVTILSLAFVTTNVYAITKPIGGGTWEYGGALQGNLKNKCQSNYYHKTKVHGSSCTMGSGSSGVRKVNKNTWSYASAYGKIWDRGAYYYYLY